MSSLSDGKNLIFGDLLPIYGCMLTDKQRDFLELYYNEDLSLGEIAENCGVSRQGVRDVIKRGEEILNSCENNFGLFRKRAEYDALMDSILSQAKELRRSLGSPSFSGLIRQKADELVSSIEGSLDLLG